jgi:S1-C subfamily serine protease
MKRKLCTIVTKFCVFLFTENCALLFTDYNGIIVTNYHVIDGAKSIKIRGVNSDFNKSYKAKVLVSDKNNDLALIQIDDFGFTSLGSIPYTIKTGLAGVGENIFVLGYPLRATMGDEIKLTNGIVSSRTGFQGDITSYQISAPVQPGNSGGPLFDSQGYLIGIINAKHGGAENASYAVKSSYLTNLIDLLPSPPKLQTVNSLTGKTLTQQVVIAKKYVYIIETE